MTNDVATFESSLVQWTMVTGIRAATRRCSPVLTRLNWRYEAFVWQSPDAIVVTHLVRQALHNTIKP